MRISAYVLGGDSAWVTESVSRYYGLVDKLVVSYDRDNRSWSGGELEVPATLARLRALDHDRKIVELPGHHSDPDRLTLDVETEQRQTALDAAADGADWVFQLDTDEVVPHQPTFLSALRIADELGRGGLDFPQRWVYQRSHDGRFLERSGRFWGRRSGYPGPVAVRAGARLSHCRQTDDDLFRVDISRRNTDAARDSSTARARVDAWVRPDRAIVHLSWVRSLDQMDRKTLVNGHAADPGWPDKLATWHRAHRHPWLTALGTPLRRDRDMWLRPTSLPVALGSADWMTED